MLAPDLIEIMLKRIEENARQRVQEESEEIVQRSEHLKSYLINIAKIGKWSLPLAIRGMETRHPEHEKTWNCLKNVVLLKVESNTPNTTYIANISSPTKEPH